MLAYGKRLSFGKKGRQARSAFMSSRKLRREAREEQFLTAVDSRLEEAKQSLGNNQKLLTGKRRALKILLVDRTRG